MICINLFQNLRKDFDLTVKKVKSVEEEIATDFANLNLSIPRLVNEEVCSILITVTKECSSEEVGPREE